MYMKAPTRGPVCSVMSSSNDSQSLDAIAGAVANAVEQMLTVLNEGRQPSQAEQQGINEGK